MYFFLDEGAKKYEDYLKCQYMIVSSIEQLRRRLL